MGGGPPSKLVVRGVTVFSARNSCALEQLIGGGKQIRDSVADVHQKWKLDDACSISIMNHKGDLTRHSTVIHLWLMTSPFHH